MQELVTIVRELAQLLNRSGQSGAPEVRQACEVLAGGSDADALSTSNAAAPASEAASLPEVSS